MKTDMQLHQDVLAELTWDPRLGEHEIGVGVKDGVVTLAGSVPNYTEKLAAEHVAERVAGVRAVANDLMVSIPSSHALSDTEPAHQIVARNLTGIRGVSSNTEIAAKRVSADSVSEGIKEALERRADRTASHIIVDFKDGVVTLTGSVPSFSDRRAAEAAAWSAPGVTEVRDALAVVF